MDGERWKMKMKMEMEIDGDGDDGDTDRYMMVCCVEYYGGVSIVLYIICGKASLNSLYISISSNVLKSGKACIRR